MPYRFLTALLLLPALCLSATAQTDDFRLGIGAAINPITVLTEIDGSDGNLSVPVQTAALFLPMQFSDAVRLEPQFSLLSMSIDKVTKDDAGRERGTFEESVSGVMIGTGVFYSFAADSSTRGYIGARLGLMATSSVALFMSVSGEKTEVSYSQNNFFYGPALGGEYFLSHSMSLGMEAGLNIVSYGSVEYEAQPSLPDPSRADINQRTVSTSALVFMRFYLN